MIRRAEIHKEVGWQTIRNIRREVDVILGNFPVLRMGRDLPVYRIDKHVYGFWKGGSSLDVVVAEQTEYTALCKDRGVVIDRAIAKTEGDT